MAKNKKNPQTNPNPQGGKTGNMGQPGQDVWSHVLKCRPVKYQTSNDHFQVLVDCNTKQFWFTINVRYTNPDAKSDNVMYLTDDNFKHPITQKVKDAKFDWGFTPIAEKAGGVAMDYVRGNLVNLKNLKSLANSNNTHTDLSALLSSYINRVKQTKDAVMYLFGSKFPLPNQAANAGSNPYSLNPNIGLHDIHMNQGSVGSHASSNASWQDGGVLIHFPTTDTWAAIFLAFETQVKSLLKKVPVTLVEAANAPLSIIGESSVKIVAAMVNPAGDEQTKETVYLINITNEPIDLADWEIENNAQKRQKLSNLVIPPHQISIVSVNALQLSNKGGIISLYDNQGQKIHGVTYTKEDSAIEDELITF